MSSKRNGKGGAKTPKRKSTGSATAGGPAGILPGPVLRPRALPAAVSASWAPHNPEFGMRGDTGSAGNVLTVSRTELVGGVTFSASGFHVSAVSAAIPGYDANPSNGILFPWLSRVAQCYEKFRFESLALTLVPAQPTSASGRVYIGFEPDYNDEVPTSKSALMGFGIANSGSVWERVDLVVPVDRINAGMPWRFNNPSSRVAVGEPRTTYAGYFVLACDNTLGVNMSWDILVSYRVLLSTPTAEALLEGNVAETLDAPALTTVPKVPPGVDEVLLPPVACAAKTDGALETVDPRAVGIGIIPPVGISGTVAVKCPYDKRGVFTFFEDLIEAGATPANVLATRNPAPDAAAFDHKGGFLGLVSSVASTVAGAATMSVGSRMPAETTTVGAPLRALMKIDWHKLSAASGFEKVKYLVPFLTSAALTYTAGGAYARQEL